MSSHAKTPHDGAVHAHISSIPLYLGVFGALLVLTLATVGQSYVDLGKANLLAVVVIASLKASLVVFFFMHLNHDSRFNALIFVGSLFFIGVFFAYTMNDTDHRGETDEAQNVHVLPRTGEAAPGGFQGHTGDPHATAPAPGGASAMPSATAPAPALHH